MRSTSSSCRQAVFAIACSGLLVLTGRAVLPAQVTATVTRQGDLVIRGTNGADGITVRSCGQSFTVEVDPPLTVNGAATATFDNVTRDVRILSRSGDDSVRIAGDPDCLSGTVAEIPRGLTITTAGGADRVELSNVGVEVKTSIVTGGGNDVVSIRDSFFPGTVLVNSGGGNDEITVAGSFFDLRAAFNGGGGADDFGVADTSFLVDPLVRGFEGTVTPIVPLVGPIASGPIALTPNGETLVNVNPDAGTLTVFTGAPSLVKAAEIAVGGDPVSVAVHPDGTTVYVANALDGTVSVVDLSTNAATNIITVGAEPMAVAVSPNGSRLYVANSASGTVSVIDTATRTTVATIDLSQSASAPGAIAVTNDADDADDDETIFVASFFSQLRSGKTSAEEGQDDQREGRVVAISSATNTQLGVSPIVLGPLLDTGFNANGMLSPATGLTPSVAPTNPQTFTTPTGAFPNQLAAIALSPTQPFAYVVSTGASPNGPLRFNSNIQGLVSVFNATTGLEVMADQTDPDERRRAPLNLNQGVNLATTPSPRLFFSNPTAMAWRPDGTDAWVVVQNSNVVVRLTADTSGIPTISAPLVSGPSTIVRVDLEAVSGDDVAGKAPRGIVIDGAGRYAYVSNFISRSVSVIDILNPSIPIIVDTAQSSDQPAPATEEAAAQLGAELFFTGRGPNGRMSSESWGGCITCHPNGRSDNVTWMFDAGPRQTIPLDGMFNKADPSDQRLLNWSAVRDENHDFELNTRGVFGGRGLIDDDRLFFAIGGAIGATPADSPLLEEFHQATGTVATTSTLAGGAALPSLSGVQERREFGIATLGDGRIYIVGGRSGSGGGTLVSGDDAVLEYDPRTNVLRRRSSTGLTPRFSLGAAAVRTASGSRVYAIGGFASTDGISPPVATVEEYDPSADTWRSVASLPQAVAESGVTVAGGINSAEPQQLIHVVSGNTGTESVPSVVNASPVQRFQADASGTGTWTTINPVGLTLRRGHGAATALRGVSSRIFVIGGLDAAGNTLATVEEYLAQGGTIVASPHSTLPAPRARFGIGTSFSTNQIYVVGGVDDLGADQATLFEYVLATNGSTPGLAGAPSGVWMTRANSLSIARRGLGLSTPPGVTNLLPVRNTGRDSRQDAIATWIVRNVRSARAPVAAADASAARGRALFAQDGLVRPSFSCATCHGGPKWTRSQVDFAAPPSPEVGLGLGNERVVGAEIRQTAAQGTNVLINVGTFTTTGRFNEVRTNAADVSQVINPLGANGFNIPSLFSVAEGAPYFYNGLAQTLEQVLVGSQDTNGGVQHHFVTNADQRADLVRFLRSIDDTTTTLP